jgi:hypothetical protein
MASLLAHCRRVLFHSCWDILLDEDFLEAYHHGVVLKCADGVLRRVFPRIFTYSADYPEKYVFRSVLSRLLNRPSIYRVLIATIKDMGLCPCPRCLTPKALFSALGLVQDMKRRATGFRTYVMHKVIEACDFIASGHTVDGAKVENALGEGSWVPIVVSCNGFLVF